MLLLMMGLMGVELAVAMAILMARGMLGLLFFRGECAAATGYARWDSCLEVLLAKLSTKDYFFRKDSLYKIKYKKKKKHPIE